MLLVYYGSLNLLYVSRKRVKLLFQNGFKINLDLGNRLGSYGI